MSGRSDALGPRADFSLSQIAGCGAPAPGIVVLADACADRDPEVHAVLTEKVFRRQARVITCAELAGLLGPAAAG